MPNVIATPHSAGFSTGNAGRVVELFISNAALYAKGERMVNVVR